MVYKKFRGLELVAELWGPTAYPHPRHVSLPSFMKHYCYYPLDETTVICRVGTSNSTLSFASYMSGWRESKGYFLMKPSTVEPLCYNELSSYRCSQLIVLQLIRTSNLIGPLWVARSSFVVGLGSIVYFVCLLFSQPIPWGLPREARSPNSFSYTVKFRK